MTSLDDVWPLFRLRLETPRLVLRPLRDGDIPHYVESARDIVSWHGDRTPFATPWNESPELGPKAARWIWESRLRADSTAWMVMFGVWSHEGRFLGSQDVGAKDFPVLRTVNTGSWLRRSAQGQGFGVEMRAAALAWAFDVLGAEVATTSAYDWNAPSLAVSRRLGYEPNGEARHSPRPGVVERELHLRLSREGFRRPGWELAVDGGEAAAVFLRG